MSVETGALGDSSCSFSSQLLAWNSRNGIEQVVRDIWQLTHVTTIMPTPPDAIRHALAAGSTVQREVMNEVRGLVFEVASDLDGIGEIEEALKWGQPTFSTVHPKSGSPFRIAPAKGADKVGLYFICTTTLVQGFRERYGDDLAFEGNRAIILDCAVPLPREPLRHCFAMALTYFVR